MFPGLVSRLAPYHHGSTTARAVRSEPDAVSVTPAQLCGAAGVAPRAEAPLRAIVFPAGLAARGTTRIGRLAPTDMERRLVAGLFHAAAPGTLAEAWTDRPPTSRWTDAALRERCAEMAATVPGYACEMGPLSAWSAETTDALRRLAAEPE
jgi:hypothetical protein